MQADFWLQRWREGRTGFHRDAPMPLLVQHWPALALPADSRVLVPLAGKSLDMPWLAAQGHRVLGVELSPLAIEQFLAENGLRAETRQSPLGMHYLAGRIELIHGDVFALDDATLAGCDAIYDRAAVIALPPVLRRRYADEVYARLRPGCRGLMITLEYPQTDMDGPPFSVDADEARARFGADWDIEVLERRDILASQPDFAERGVGALHTSVYALRRRGSTAG
jgi:thiopurine S-methyltransferase